jgi:hypothetical protein
MRSSTTANVTSAPGASLKPGAASCLAPELPVRGPREWVHACCAGGIGAESVTTPAHGRRRDVEARPVLPQHGLLERHQPFEIEPHGVNPRVGAATDDDEHLLTGLAAQRDAARVAHGSSDEVELRHSEREPRRLGVLLVLRGPIRDRHAVLFGDPLAVRSRDLEFDVNAARLRAFERQPHGRAAEAVRAQREFLPTPPGLAAFDRRLDLELGCGPA